MSNGTVAPMPTPIPTPVQSRSDGPEESDFVVVGAATTIEGMPAVSISVLVPDSPVSEPPADDDEVDSDADDEVDDDVLDNDELDELDEADDIRDAD
ncbi:hypothetical protein QM012_003532 [Aureobasidium pullulans]|uniref:Uncharacterized protein n=1 Tax=Aureobasidium pullulans TaxID=5580 RepID=A0ABR0T915_AURPU